MTTTRKLTLTTIAATAVIAATISLASNYQTTTSATNAPAVITLPAVAGQIQQLYSIEAACSAGAAALQVQNGTTTVWSTGQLVTTPITINPQPITSTTDTALAITLSSCGSGNTGTLTVASNSEAGAAQITWQEDTGAANTTLTDSIAGVAKESVYLAALRARCSGGSSSIEVKDGVGGTIVWSQQIPTGTDPEINVNFSPQVVTATGNGMDIVLAPCGTGYTGTIDAATTVQ